MQFTLQKTSIIQNAMLYLSRKVGESIVINNNITLTVKEVKGKTVKLGFSFPADASILRKEVHDRIHEENAAAMLTDADVFSDDLMFEVDVLESASSENE